MEILAIKELNLSHHIPSNQIQIFTLFPSSSAVKNPPANAGNSTSIPGLERSPGEGNGHPRRTPWIEEPGGLHAVHGSQRVGQDRETNTHID